RPAQIVRIQRRQQLVDVLADGYGVGAQRVAELDGRIAILTQLRDSLVHRMPWLAASDDSADEQAV
ncbi:hypothetical protein AB0D71_47705, partial [Streptomyces avermitilis]